MTQENFVPYLKKIKETSVKVDELCKRADAGILLLDDLIAHLEEENRSSTLYQYRLNKAKRLLNIDA